MEQWIQILIEMAAFSLEILGIIVPAALAIFLVSGVIRRYVPASKRILKHGHFEPKLAVVAAVVGIIAAAIWPWCNGQLAIPVLGPLPFGEQVRLPLIAAPGMALVCLFVYCLFHTSVDAGVSQAVGYGTAAM